MSQICHYCGAELRQTTGAEIYPGKERYVNLKFVCCQTFPVCDAYVGCHELSGEPFGIVAREPLRLARNRAHAAFDSLWKTDLPGTNPLTRRIAYVWLRKVLGLTEEQAHIGQFKEDVCVRVIEAVRIFWITQQTLYDHRATLPDGVWKQNKKR